MAEPIVLVAGADPLEGVGGHSSYVRAHGRALRRAGFDPHVFCVSPQAGAVETEFGLVHRARLRWGLDRFAAFRFRKHQLVWRLPRIVRAVEAFVLANRRVRLVHGFGVYASVGVMAARALRRRGVEVIPVASAYDRLAREALAKLLGARAAHGPLQRLVLAAELAWTRAVVDRFERRGYTGARLVLVNYDSVRRLLGWGYGLGGTIRKLPYASERAFRDGEPRSEAPPALAALEPRTAPLLVAVSRHDPEKSYVRVTLSAVSRVSSTNAWLNTAAVSGSCARCANPSFPASHCLALWPVVTLYRSCPHACQRLVPHQMVKERSDPGALAPSSEPIGIISNEPSSRSRQISIVVRARRSRRSESASVPVAVARSSLVRGPSASKSAIRSSAATWMAWAIQLLVTRSGSLWANGTLSEPPGRSWLIEPCSTGVDPFGQTGSQARSRRAHSRTKTAAPAPL